MEIIRTKDMVELDDDKIREIIMEHVGAQLGRKAAAVNFYHTNVPGPSGARMHAKVFLDFED